MLTAFWFKTFDIMGYGVTAESLDAAKRILRDYGYPRAGETITSIVENVKIADLDENHVVRNCGPIVVRGIWHPRHNV